AQRQGGDLHQVRLLHAHERMGVGEQEPAADRHEERHHARPPGRHEAPLEDQPLEDPQRRGQEREGTMLKHLRIHEAAPERLCRAQRPRVRVGAQQQERGERQEQQGPVPRPGRAGQTVGGRRGASGSSSAAAAASSVKLGVEKAGQRGAKRLATSAPVARSATMSTPGGADPSEAATKTSVTPSPASTSTKRRSRAGRIVCADGTRRTVRKSAAPRARSPATSVVFASSMPPYAVPISAPGPPTYTSASTRPAAASTATATWARREKARSAPAGHAASPRASRSTVRWTSPPAHAAVAI